MGRLLVWNANLVMDMPLSNLQARDLSINPCTVYPIKKYKHIEIQELSSLYVKYIQESNWKLRMQCVSLTNTREHLHAMESQINFSHFYKQNKKDERR